MSDWLNDKIDRLPPEIRHFLRSPWPWIIIGVLAIGGGLLSGCASVFDAPVQAQPIANPDKTPAEWRVVCDLLFDNVRWLMTVPAGSCPGWARI